MPVPAPTPEAVIPWASVSDPSLEVVPALDIDEAAKDSHAPEVVCAPEVVRLPYIASRRFRGLDKPRFVEASNAKFTKTGRQMRVSKTSGVRKRSFIRRARDQIAKDERKYVCRVPGCVKKPRYTRLSSYNQHRENEHVERRLSQKDWEVEEEKFVGCDEDEEMEDWQFGGEGDGSGGVGGGAGGGAGRGADSGGVGGSVPIMLF